MLLDMRDSVTWQEFIINMRKVFLLFNFVIDLIRSVLKYVTKIPCFVIKKAVTQNISFF